jgi:hypothetical protein
VIDVCKEHATLFIMGSDEGGDLESDDADMKIKALGVWLIT